MNQYGMLFGTKYDMSHGTGIVSKETFAEKFLLPETVNILREQGKPDRVLSMEESIEFYNKYMMSLS